MKNILLYVVTLLLVLPVAFSADIFKPYDFTFSNERPTSLYIEGAECTSSSCSNVNSRKVELYNGPQFETCYNNYIQNQNQQQFLSCINNAKIQGNVVNLAQNDFVVVKSQFPSTFGHLIQFFPSQDSYYPAFATQDFVQCNYDICIDSNFATVNFVKGVDAIAEVQQLNVMNTNNPLLPIQVEVPVEIEETVCSAYLFSNPNMHRFQPPSGYSDYSSLTDIDLTITRESNGQLLSEQTVQIPILAETCGSLQTFNWFPPSNLENEEVTFRVETEVTDNQVINSIIDWAEVTETIYPQDLQETAYARVFDMTLSNVPTFDLNSGISQIQEGETLYLGYRAGAFRVEIDNSLTPIQYNLDVLFDGQEIYSDVQLSDGDLDDYFLDLSDEIAGLPPGEYTVTIVADPICPTCSLVEDVEVSQNLVILSQTRADIDFLVTNVQSNPISGASINFELTDPSGNFQIPPTYNENRNTNNQGRTSFDNVPLGQYQYTVSATGFNTKVRDITIGSDRYVHVILDDTNEAPRVNLPSEFTEYFENAEVIDLRDYITDPDNTFNQLDISVQVLSGVGNAVIVGDELRVTTTQVGDVALRVRAEDPAGLTGQDTTVVYFIDNEDPIVLDFVATPDNGQRPLDVEFDILVTDPDSDSLTCRITYGDGQNSGSPRSCSGLDGVNHIYQNIGTYTATLIVDDGTNTVQETETIFVFDNPAGIPVIDSFTLDSSQGLNVPTDLTLEWQTSHTTDLPLTCTLSVNGQTQSVGCDSDIDIDNYNREGVGTFRIVAVDSNGASAQRTITRTFSNPNERPIVTLNANPTRGDAPLATTFTFSAVDPDGDLLTCVLNFDDGTQGQEFNCNSLSQISKTYTRFGSYDATLTATDPDGLTGSASVRVTVNEKISDNNPQVTLSANPTNGQEPLFVSFTSTVTDVDGDLDRCLLNFGDGSQIRETSCFSITPVSHTYQNNGVYTAILTAIDSRGNTGESRVNIVVNDNPGSRPNVDLSATPRSGEEPLSVSFTSTVTDTDNDLNSCTLNFGDGSSPRIRSCSSVTPVSHTYQSEGVYVATLTAVDDKGNSNSDSVTITVSDNSGSRPNVDLSATPRSGEEPLSVSFTSTVTDTDNDLNSCTLNFGDGSSPRIRSCSSVTPVSHTYQSEGVYVATLTAVDDKGNSNSDSVTITVAEDDGIAPIVDLVATPREGEEPLSVSFTSTITDIDGDLNRCELDFGDGSPIRQTSCQSITPIIHDYTSAGTYTAVLRAFDNQNNAGVDSEIIKVNIDSGNAPVVDLRANPRNGEEPLEVRFVATITDVDADLDQCELNFGDGSPVVRDECLSISPIDHVYTSEGSFTATLVAIDRKGNVGSDSEIINVEVDEGVSPEVDLRAIPTSGEEPLTVSFTSTVTDADGDLDECILNFGDGSSPVTTSCNSITPISHVYLDSGNYIATLTAFDSRSNTGSDSVQINVEVDSGNEPIVDLMADPTTGEDLLVVRFTSTVTDIDGDLDECILNFGDGSSPVTASCNSITPISHVYQNSGSYLATLTAIDSKGNTGSDSVEITVNVDFGVDPVVDLRASPLTGEEPLQVTFTSTVTDTDGDLNRCELDFGDGTQTLVSNCLSITPVVHTYQTEGVYTAILRAFDDAGNVGTDSVIINVVDDGGVAPVVNLEADPISGLEPLTVRFTSIITDTDGDIDRCELDFGDGSPARETSCVSITPVLHVYQNAGTYTAVLRAFDDEGNVGSDFEIIEVEVNNPGSAPVVDLIATPTSGEDPLTVTFTSTVTDIDGDLGRCILNFGDGSEVIETSCVSITPVTHTYSEGVYTATLTAFDQRGNVGQDQEIITVNEFVGNNVPEVFLDATPNEGEVPLSVLFSSFTADIDNDLVSCILDFGDGTTQNVACPGTDNVNHIYTDVGTYVAILTGTDSRGNTEVSTEIIVVTKPQAAPIVDLNATPTFGDEDLFVVFSSLVVDPNGDDTLCTLNFGDGSLSITRDCNLITPQSHVYTEPGVFTATLTASDIFGNVGSDSVQITVNEVIESTPVIELFTVDSTNGDFVPTNLDISWRITHTFDLPMTCTLTVNGISERVNCIDSLDIFNYVELGIATFTISAVDENGVSVSQTITKDFDSNGFLPPEILLFNATPTRGQEPLDVRFDLLVEDPEGSETFCELDFGDGSTPRIGKCDDLAVVDHTYQRAGTYFARLFANDDVGAFSTRMVMIIVEPFSGPVVEEFEIRTEDGTYFVPNNVTLNWRVVHTGGENMTCTLRVRNDISVVPCIGLETLTNFSVEGFSQFEITGVDNDGVRDSALITKEFIDRARNTVDTALIIDPVINPGEFSFTLRLTDEGLRERLVSVEPMIYCNGLEVGIDTSDNKLDSSAVSKKENSVEDFVFNLDTQDFEFNIPKDEKCEFRVALMDEFGTAFDVLSAPVTFSYFEDERTYVSIRGNSFDIVDFMRTTLLEDYRSGYYTIDFAVENNDGEEKDVEVSVISAELGISVSDGLTLGDGSGDEQGRVQVPIFIRDGTEPGLYPVRISANVDGNKQTKYSYLNVVE